MKKMFLMSVALFIAATIFCGCSKDEIYDEGELTIDVTDLVLKCPGGEEYIPIYSSSDWTAKVMDADNDWCSCYNVHDEFLYIVICANDTFAERSASIVVQNQTQKKTINVVQKANPTDPAEIRLTVTCTEDVLQAEVAKYFGGNVTSITNDNGTYVITLKHGCYAIPHGAFGATDYSGPEWLTSVELNSSVFEVGEAAFTGCRNLTTFRGQFASPDNKSLLFENRLIAFANGCGITSYTIPDSVTEIGYSAFYNCDSLTSVTIPDSVTEIGYSAFHSCNSLTSVTIPDSVTEIGNSAFKWCNSLTSVTIPDSVTEIGNSAFKWCNSLTSVTIGKGVTLIGDDAFGHDNIHSMVVYCNPITPPKVSGSPFTTLYISTTGYPSTMIPKTIYVPAESLQSYQHNSGWSEYSSVLKGRYL